MIEATRVQFPIWVAKTMGDVDMSSMPRKDIGKKAYLWAQSPLRPSKDLEPKRYLNT
jgi:hypothetical protein